MHGKSGKYHIRLWKSWQRICCSALYGVVPYAVGDIEPSVGHGSACNNTSPLNWWCRIVLYQSTILSRGFNGTNINLQIVNPPPPPPQQSKPTEINGERLFRRITIVLKGRIKNQLARNQDSNWLLLNKLPNCEGIILPEFIQHLDHEFSIAEWIT